MIRINILNKEGLLSGEDKKQPLVHSCEHLTFRTNLDLTEPIKLEMFGTSGKITLQRYTRDIASFFVWWEQFVRRDLNGFSGFHNVKFELVNFEIVDL